MGRVDLNLMECFPEFFVRVPMNIGTTLCAQLMDFLPWTTFTRIVERYDDDRQVRRLSCVEQYRAMAFAQLTRRESLRDIEICLSVRASKLYHVSFRQPVRRSTLADASEGRDWRIYAEVVLAAHRPGAEAVRRRGPGVGVDQYVCALDSTTSDLCLSVFPRAHFRKTKATVKMHTLFDLRGSIPSFIPISDGKMRDVNALDMPMPEAGAVDVMNRGYVDFFPPSWAAPEGRLLRHARQVEHGFSSGLLSADASRGRHHLRPGHLPGRQPRQPELSRTSAPHPLQGP
jgi:hypothetical protein